jgi:hypothetical protein
VDRIVVNALHPARFSAAEARVLDGTARAGGGTAEARALEGAARAGGKTPRADAPAAEPSAVARAALAAALSEHRRARAEHAQLRRLRRAATAPVVTLPRVFEPELSRGDLERLSAELERKL